jgi:hypothetical protein
MGLYTFQHIYFPAYTHNTTSHVKKIKGKGKFYPRAGHEGPEGEYKYSYTLSLTSALQGVAGQGRASTALPPGKHPVPFVQEAVWAPGPVWTSEILAPNGIRSQDRPASIKSL